MSKILLDYVFPITMITPTPAASTAFLKQACLVCKPKSGMEGSIGTITLCTSTAAVAALTDNVDATQLFAAGMNRVYILLAADLDLASVFDDNNADFYTLLISDDFNDDDVESEAATGTVTISSYANLIDTAPDTITVAGEAFVAQSGAVVEGANTFRAATSNELTAASLANQINTHDDLDGVVTAVAVGAIVTITAVEHGSGGNALTLTYTDGSPTTTGASVSGSGTLAGGDGFFMGQFEGVIGLSSTDVEFCEEQNAIENRCCFFTSNTNKFKNGCYAFGKLLSNPSNWNNQQYITMPLNDGVDELGEANNLFDSNKISFVINDTEFGNRLALFAVGGKAIVAPYILKNLQVDLQSRALQWISANQPFYTVKEASLLETRLQEDVINEYINILKWIESGSIEITLVNDNFVANGSIDVSEPRALWRVFNEMVAQ